MKRIQVAAAILLFCFQATAVVDYRNVTGSLGVIKAFQALQTGNINSLVEALGQRPSPVNEGLAIQTSQGEVRFRLIHAAALTKSEQMLKVLITAGARVSATDSLGHTPVHYSSGAVPELSQPFNFHPATDGWWASQMLIIFHSAGVSLEAVDHKGRQAMHYAAAMGAKSVLQTLIHLGAPIDPLDAEGKTPVHLAAGQMHFETVEFLRSKGASSEVHFYDYLVGCKNRASDLLYNHPIGAAVAAVSIVAINFVPRLYGRLMAGVNSPRTLPQNGQGGGGPGALAQRPQGSPAREAPSPARSPAPERRPSPQLPPGGDQPKKGSVAAAAGAGGAALTAGVALPRALAPAPNAAAVPAARQVVAVGQPAAQPAAAAPPPKLKPEDDAMPGKQEKAPSKIRVAKAAMAGLNAAAKNPGEQTVEGGAAQYVIIAELDAANAAFDSLRGTQDPQEAQARTHLIAAVRAIHKLKNLPVPVRERVDAIWAPIEKWENKHSRH